MSFAIQQELQQVGRTLSAWQAQTRGAVWIAAALLALWAFALTDLFLQYEQAGRLVTWLILVGLCAAGAWMIAMALKRKRTVQGIAARIERAFPKLDNHLINFVQFLDQGGDDSMKQAYLARGVPEWAGFNIGILKDRKSYWLSIGALGLAGCVMAGTLALAGPAWKNAVLRIVNPFSPRPPATLAHIRAVTPGDAAVLIGSSVSLACEATGKSGQPVTLELWPKDDKKSVIKMGKIAGTDTQSFPYRIPKISTETEYRFTVGDAYGKRHTIRVLPPLAFKKITLNVIPPPYTALEKRFFDGIAEDIVIPEGSHLNLIVRCNRPLKDALVTGQDEEELSMDSPDKGETWTADLEVTTAAPLELLAADKDDWKAGTSIKFQLLPDKPPAVRVIAPATQTVLTPGSKPDIQFEASDEYGLSRIVLERIPADAKADTPGAPVKEWTLTDGDTLLATNWNEAVPMPPNGQPLAFRLTAYDNCPPAIGGPRKAQSPPIVFASTLARDAAKKEKESADKTQAALADLVALQKKNLDDTTKLNAIVDVAEAAQWTEVSTVQKQIRALAGKLLVDPRKPMGTLTDSLKELYTGAMQEVIDSLERIPTTEKDGKAALSRKSVLLEDRILRTLTRVETGVEKSKPNREITGLLALLEALVHGQTGALDQTKALGAKTIEVGKTLLDKQEGLYTDTSAFVQRCRAESQSLAVNEPDFAKLAAQVADGCESRKVAANMLRAVEQLENKAPSAAVPLQSDALKALEEFQKLMSQWRSADATNTMAQAKEALGDAKEKLEKMMDVQAKVLDSIREVKRQKDASGDKKRDAMEEEAEEIDNAMQEAMLQIATDLQVLPELPVANDVVDDVFQIFEENRQIKGSEKTKKAEELGLQKEDMITDLLEKMKDTKKRIDDMESWLTPKPDSKKRDIESFDKAEMPEIPLVPLPSEMEDIIGDLLKQEEEQEKKSDDSTGNQSLADAAMGWDVAQGEWTTYDAKGKSGNERPDHKEQDGRSTVGRQGQSDGETAAGSGKINEGDENIEKRMTQDKGQSGQVQEEGHAKAKATGGGKGSGYGDELGMAGTGDRRDSQVQKGSEKGMQAMLRRNAEALYARASMSHIKTGSLDEVVKNMRLAEDAEARNAPIRQIREYQRRAVAALKKCKTELGAGVLPGDLDGDLSVPPIEDQLAGASDEAPANYRDLVADYFKSLNTAP
ncbi:MAG: DUF4175 family protein [Lentisphaerae bacterium]|nr:DUF4175 family protein [Lentisphaerota bacterium]